MNTLSIIASLVGAMALGACGAPTAATALPQLEARKAPNRSDEKLIVASIPAPGGDTSVPDATAVFAADDAVAVAKTGQHVAAPLTSAQESAAMPMPGQANDHSTTEGKGSTR